MLIPKSRPIRHYVREWRKFRGLTQERLAERTPFTTGAISQLETGRTKYTQDMLEALADALQCTPADLLMRDPLREGAVWSIEDQLKSVSLERRNQIIAVVETLLKTG
jgi:transcriptional regulator with XRE-family HTH domain